MVVIQKNMTLKLLDYSLGLRFVKTINYSLQFHYYSLQFLLLCEQEFYEVRGPRDMFQSVVERLRELHNSNNRLLEAASCSLILADLLEKSSLETSSKNKKIVWSNFSKKFPHFFFFFFQTLKGKFA